MQFHLQQYHENGDIPQGAGACDPVQTAISKDMDWDTYHSSEWQEPWLGLIPVYLGKFFSGRNSK